MNQKTATILIINSQQNSEVDLLATIKELGHTIIEADPGCRILDMVCASRPQIVLVGLNNADPHWSDILSDLSGKAPAIPVITFAENPLVEDVIQSFQMGATDCLLPPMATIEKISRSINRALNKTQTCRKNRDTQKDHKGGMPGIPASAARISALEAELSAIREKLVVEQEQRAYEQVSVLEYQRLFDIMFNNTHDLILHLDSNGVVMNTNDVIKTLFGLTPQAIIGTNFSDYTFLGPDYMQAIELYKSAAPDTPFPVFNLEAFHKNSTPWSAVTRWR